MRAWVAEESPACPAASAWRRYCWRQAPAAPVLPQGGSPTPRPLRGTLARRCSGGELLIRELVENYEGDSARMGSVRSPGRPKPYRFR